VVKIKWTEISLIDLKEIHDYISEDSSYYASVTVNKIYHKVDLISKNLYLGKITPEINEKLIRKVIEGNYRIIYRIKNENEVDILRIYHTSRLLKKL
jgi:plasmid stabilization system protein ParE